MKVGTDGVLLGAWTPVSGAHRILDIGTGTGLLALMLAQRCDAEIDAIEIDAEAASQASENVLESGWSARIKVIQTSFQDYCRISEVKYDLLVCNPPFFSKSLKANTEPRSLARHNDQLGPSELFAGAIKLLNPNGHLCIILPAGDGSLVITLAKEHGLFPSKILRIKPDSGKPFKRILIDFTFSDCLPQEAEMTIETGQRHIYSEEYINLTGSYYFNM